MRRIAFILVLIIGAVLVYYFYPRNQGDSSLARTQKNYGKEIDRICASKQLPAPYFKALTILESSGHKPAASRFEPHVYQTLIDVKEGKVKQYGRFNTAQMKLLSDETIRKMATSWGPLQIMGYHCVPMGISFEDLQGPDAMEFAITWAEQTYGAYLQNHNYKDALHIHNTGKPIPQSGRITTTDPNYIDKGLSYIQKLK